MIFRIVLTSFVKDQTGKLKTLRGGLFSSDVLTDDDVMFFDYLLNDLGIKAPKKMSNNRARFFFTEAGWNRVGKVITKEIDRKGYKIKIIKKKNPKSSDIYYSDPYQIAVYPESLNI